MYFCRTHRVPTYLCCCCFCCCCCWSWSLRISFVMLLFWFVFADPDLYCNWTVFTFTFHDNIHNFQLLTVGLTNPDEEQSCLKLLLLSQKNSNKMNKILSREFGVYSLKIHLRWKKLIKIWLVLHIMLPYYRKWINYIFTIYLHWLAGWRTPPAE